MSMVYRNLTRLAIAGLLAPLAALVLAAFSDGWRYPALLRPGRGLALLLDPALDLLPVLGTSLLISGLVATAAVAIALPAAISLAGRQNNRLTILALMIPAAVPGLSVAMGLNTVFLRMGLTGNLAGVIIVQLIPAIPYALLVLMNAAATRDPGFVHAARGLGASRLQAIRYALLPMLQPAIVTAFVFAFLVSWSQYGLTLLIGGGRVVTLPLIVTQFLSAGRLDIAGVVSLLALIPALGLFAIAASVSKRRA